MTLLDLGAGPDHGPAAIVTTGDQPADLASVLKAPSISLLAERGIRLCLGEGHFLKRFVLVPRSAAPSLESILALEVNRFTPFKADEVVSAWSIDQDVREDGKIQVNHVIVKRSDLATWVAQLKSLGLAVRSATAGSGRHTWIDHDLLQHLRETPSRLERWQSRGKRGLLAVAVSCLLLVPFVVLHKHSEATQWLDEEIERHRSQAMKTAARFKEVESSTAVIARLGHRKAALPPLVAIIEEMTRVVPDTAWLSTLSMEGDDVSLSGQAGSAAELLATLEASDMFAGVRFTAPVYRDPSDGSQRFSMTMKLSPGTTLASALQ